MFHKEGSCVVVVSTGSSQGSGNKANSNNKGKAGNKTNNNNNNSKGKAGKGGKAQQPNTEESSVSRAVDVPLRKSDRRRLRERATAYFLGAMNDATDTNSNSNSNSNESVSENENEDENESFPNHNPLEGLLDAIFSKGGTISSRSLPAPKSTTTIPRAGTTKGNHESLILYVKSPNNDHYNDSNNDSNNNNNNNNNKRQGSQSRGGKKGPCKFFAQGRCRKGNDCPFSHDTGGGGGGGGGGFGGGGFQSNNWSGFGGPRR